MNEEATSTRVIGRLWYFTPLTIDNVTYSIPITEENTGLWIDANEFLLGLGYNRNTLTQSIYKIIDTAQLTEHKDYIVFSVHDDDIVPLTKYAFSIDASIAICDANNRNETCKTAIAFLKNARSIIVAQSSGEASLLGVFTMLDVLFPVYLFAHCLKAQGYNDGQVSDESVIAMFVSDGLLSKRKTGVSIRKNAQGLFRRVGDDLMCTPHGFHYLLRKYTGASTVQTNAVMISICRYANQLRSASLFETERYCEPMFPTEKRSEIVVPDEDGCIAPDF